MPYKLPERQKKLWSEIYFTPFKQKQGRIKGYFGAKTLQNGPIFFTRLPYIYKTYILQKPVVQNDQPGPQQWSEGNTAAYIGFPPPNRLSTQRASDRYKDHLDGQLTRDHQTKDETKQKFVKSRLPLFDHPVGQLDQTRLHQFFYKTFAQFIQVSLYLMLYLAERRSSASSLVRSQLLIRDRIRQPVPAVPINIRDLAHIYRSYRSNSFHHPGRTIWRPLPIIAKGTRNLKR